MRAMAWCFRALIVGVLGLLAAPGALSADEPSEADRTFFENKVRPILVERCYECHATNSKTVRGGLLLDSKAGWEKGGDSGPAIELGDAEASLIVQAIRYDDPVLKMPPKGRLSDAEIAVLAEWVKRGAPDPRSEAMTTVAPRPARVINFDQERTHWAYQPLAHAEPPRVRDEAWCRTDIDRFILARLEAVGLTPTGEPERHVLIRRAYFDLIGLPPTPKEVAAFENDDSDGAFERVIERLLESPHYGERWARHWLDLARFAESHGFEHDYDRPHAYTYRDFVIDAFNQDLPYDTFVKWQIAGDEYEPENHMAMKATGFLGAGTHSTQITKNQVEKERYDELDDMLSTTGTAFLGLTIGCARCHDHKFDPIPAEDYYRLLSTFTTTVRSDYDLVYDPERHRAELAKYDADHKPYVDALARYEQSELPARLDAWERDRERTPSRPPRWVVLDPLKIESKGGATSRKLADGSILFEGKNPDFDTYIIVAACDLAEITAIGIEALSDPSLPHGGPGRAENGNFALTGLGLKMGPRYGIGATTEPRLVNPKATFEQAGLPASAIVDDDPKSGWAVDPKFGSDHAVVFEIGSNLRTDSGCTLTFTLEFANNTGHQIGRLRVAVTDSPRPVGIDDNGIPGAIAAVLATLPGGRSSEQQRALLDWYRTIDLGWRALNQEIEDHAKTAPRAEGVKALICSEGVPPIRLHTQGDDFLPETHILRRGDPDQKESVASQSFLRVLMNAPEAEAHWVRSAPEGCRTSYRRRALAEWITDTEYGAGQLLARVIVNRVWEHHFGRGLVSTPSDFGTQGSRPSHPELLDWLAGELIRGGWKLKPLHKLIMSSAVYRQGSQVDRDKQAIDSANSLWWRQERQRLEAEPFRDALLCVSGVLDRRMHGPGSLDERMRRRAIYFTIKRSQLIRFLSQYDAPDALTPIATRSSTIVAPQSLILLNSPIVREWAQAFARSLEDAVGRDGDAVTGAAYRRALGRFPRDDELTAARDFLRQQTKSHQESGHDEPDQLALADLCQVLFGLNEFIYVE
jgi:hypothetical protein